MAMWKRILFTLLFLPLVAVAHVGSPDVYYDGYAGSYHLLVTVRPPLVIPGLAEIQVRTASSAAGMRIIDRLLSMLASGYMSVVLFLRCLQDC